MRGKVTYNSHTMNEKSESFQVFLCYADVDTDIAKELHLGLIKDSIESWFREENLLPGQDRWHEVENAIRDSDIVIVLLSNDSIHQEGPTQRELKLALDTAKEKTEGSIFIIPVRIDRCDVPSSLSKWQPIDWFEGDRGDRYKTLVFSLEKRAEELGKNLKTLNRENDLSFICEICKQPIDSYTDAGEIYTLWDDINLAEEKDAQYRAREGELIRASDIDIEALIARWHVSHYKCAHVEYPHYSIAIYRMRTIKKALAWTIHLMDKRWIGLADWPELIRSVTANLNL